MAQTTAPSPARGATGAAGTNTNLLGKVLARYCDTRTVEADTTGTTSALPPVDFSGQGRTNADNLLGRLFGSRRA